MTTPPAERDALLTIPEIAAMFNRAIGTVEYWRLNDILPDPDQVLGRTLGWYRSTLVEWGKQTGRLRPDGTALPKPGPAVRTDVA